MTFDVFRLRERAVGEYRDCVESFVHMLDARIEAYVRQRLVALVTDPTRRTPETFAALKPLGVRHIDMPLTPERLWRAIREASGG
jgi:hypothetical protein